MAWFTALAGFLVCFSFCVQADDNVAWNTASEGLAAAAPKLQVVLGQVLEDSGEREILDRWGLALNFDENANAEIVPGSILEMFCGLAGVELQDRKVHAGVQHTYGYLFSTLDTPFGFKRKRWIDPAIEEGFGLQKESLSPEPEGGTLLANLTHFLGGIAFTDRRRDSDAIADLGSSLNLAAKEIVNYPFHSLRGKTIIETVQVAKYEFEFQTDVIEFPNQPEDVGSSETHLLVYSVRYTRKGELKLITAFPIQQGFAERLISTQSATDVEVKPRYNAFVAEEFSTDTYRGDRFVRDYVRN